LIQNYDKGGRYLEMISKAVQWKKELAVKAKLILMMPFFSVSATNGQPLSTEEVALKVKEDGLTSRRLSQGMCLYSLKNKQRFYVPCFAYFREAFEMAKEAEGVGFWEGGNGLESYFKWL
jgi:hypothetical protein